MLRYHLASIQMGEHRQFRRVERWLRRTTTTVLHDLGPVTSPRLRTAPKLSICFRKRCFNENGSVMELTSASERLISSAMAWQIRIEFPGAIYHVMARGDRREPIVTDDEDRDTFVRTLGEGCGRSGFGFTPGCSCATTITCCWKRRSQSLPRDGLAAERLHQANQHPTSVVGSPFGWALQSDPG